MALVDLVEVGLLKSTSGGTGLENEISRVVGSDGYRNIIYPTQSTDPQPFAIAIPNSQ
ncbi:uncharacterized protein ARMOST_01550 [Armillaria ostoyae]|uniref:Uncharacterized protein n=1 Tax=Armillaria ostoyae TaxID=47428 RepID=A0A284QPA1_ARMOS|nr:uncharacterized protein ARMOST_01550 [Armillaria ostoyae]